MKRVTAQALLWLAYRMFDVTEWVHMKSNQWHSVPVFWIGRWMDRQANLMVCRAGMHWPLTDFLKEDSTCCT